MTGSTIFRMLLVGALVGACVGSGALRATAAPKVKKPALVNRSSNANGPVPLTEDVGGLSIDWSQGKLVVKGLGVGGDRGPTPYRRSLSSRAATADAYRRLAAGLALVRVDASTRMQDLVVADDGLRKRLNAFVKAAKVLETNYQPDGSAEVVLGADLRGPQGLSGLLAGGSAPIEPSQAPSLAPSSTPSMEIVTAPVPLHTHYSALILDARGTGAQPAILPAVRDANGKAIDLDGNGGHPNIRYFKDGADFDPTAGIDPLKLRATRTQGLLHADLGLGIDATRALKTALADKKLAADAPVLVLL